jgi:signal peptidase I
LDELALRFYKPFYLPAQSMAPTIAKNDRIVASMSGALPLRRGDVVLFDTRRRVFIKRVAGLPGDRVAMVRGLVVLNGRAIPQLSIRTEWTQGIDGGVQAKRLSEQFPGEERAHHVYDLGESPLDDMPEQEVRQGHVFLLGDNRDLSADSRVPKAMDGVEQVPLGNVRGRALFFGFGRLEKMGRPID